MHLVFGSGLRERRRAGTMNTDTFFYPPCRFAQYVNSWPKVLNAITLAGEYGIGVLLDMHGVQGSQNGEWPSAVVFLLSKQVVPGLLLLAHRP